MKHKDKFDDDFVSQGLQFLLFHMQPFLIVVKMLFHNFANFT